MLTGGIRVCRHCNGEGHTAFTCPRKPRKALSSKKKLNKSGKMAKKYKSLRADFFELYPAPHYCYYCLYLNIEIELEESQTQVEHYLSKVRHPGLRLDIKNCVKSCAYHNKLKGSLDGPEFLELLDETKGGLTS